MLYREDFYESFFSPMDMQHCISIDSFEALCHIIRLPYIFTRLPSAAIKFQSCPRRQFRSSNFSRVHFFHRKVNPKYLILATICFRKFCKNEFHARLKGIFFHKVLSKTIWACFILSHLRSSDRVHLHAFVPIYVWCLKTGT